LETIGEKEIGKQHRQTHFKDYKVPYSAFKHGHATG